MDLKTSKLTELTMSNRIFGQLFEKETALKLKPNIKMASYFTINSDLSNFQTSTYKISKNSFDECFFIVSDEISRRLAIFSGDDLQETVDNITPHGMTILGGGKHLVVIDKYGGGIGNGVSTLNFYSLNNDNNKITLIDKTCRTTNGNLVSCLSHDEKYSKNEKINNKTNSDISEQEDISDSTSLNKLDLPKGVCKLWQPRDIALSKHGNLIVSDVSPTSLNRLSMFTPEGKLITEFGRASGPGNQSFQKPLHLSVDTYGRILASDYLTNTIQIYDNRGLWLHSVGNPLNTTVKDKRSSLMLGYDARLQGPLGLTCDTLGNIIVCDSTNNRLAMFASDGKFIENVKIENKLNSRCYPVSVKIDNNLNVLAACYHINRKDTFQKIVIKGIKPTCV